VVNHKRFADVASDSYSQILISRTSALGSDMLDSQEEAVSAAPATTRGSLTGIAQRLYVSCETNDKMRRLIDWLGRTRLVS
jgi:hypothetical protein